MSRFAKNTGLITLAALGWAIQSASCHAQIFFDLIEPGTNDVLAILELSSLPATHVNVESLIFTDRWETVYGVGPGLYPGEFTATSVGTVDILADGTLGCVECAFDEGNSFIDSVSNGVFDAGEVSLYFASTFPDFVRIAQAASGIDRTVVGRWVPVPEPAGLLLVGVAALCRSVAARSRRRMP